jgi:hypothetical protein
MISQGRKGDRPVVPLAASTVAEDSVAEAAHGMIELIPQAVQDRSKDQRVPKNGPAALMGYSLALRACNMPAPPRALSKRKPLGRLERR